MLHQTLLSMQAGSNSAELVHLEQWRKGGVMRWLH